MDLVLWNFVSKCLNGFVRQKIFLGFKLCSYLFLTLVFKSKTKMSLAIFQLLKSKSSHQPWTILDLKKAKILNDEMCQSWWYQWNHFYNKVVWDEKWTNANEFQQGRPKYKKYLPHFFYLKGIPKFEFKCSSTFLSFTSNPRKAFSLCLNFSKK